jgi:putative nucleotidyltransferase with HDIG domain
MMKNITTYFRNIRDYFREKTFFGIEAFELLSKFGLGFILVIMIVSIMPRERPFEYGNLTVGSIAQEEIIAPLFGELNDYENVQAIKLNNLLIERSLYFQSVSSIPPSVSTNKDFKKDTLNSDSILAQVSLKYNFDLNENDLKRLFKLYQADEYDDFTMNLTTGFEKIYEQGIIDITKNRVEESEITLIQNGVEEETSKNEILDVEEAKQVLQDYFILKYKDQEREYQLAEKLSNSFLTADFIFEQSMTQNRKNKAVREVPTTSGFVHENQRIIDNHEIVTQDIYQKLQSMAIALSERSGSQSGWYQLLFNFGKYIFAIVLTLMVAFFLYFYRKSIFTNNSMLLMITAVFILQLLTAMLVQNVLEWSYLAIPVTLGPMLLSMLLDATVAFMGTIIISLVLGAAGGNNFYLALMTFVVGTIALLYSVQKIRNRGQMFRAILYIMLGYLTVNFSYGFLHYESLNKMLQNFAFYQLPNAILAPTAVFLLIGIFEKLFDVTTDITLLELSDLNHPLLKRLSVEAPGTFHHSIIVGNLAEAAAKEIGANSLLARVGCYYHDIGKMQLSEYFVENQAAGPSKHETLAPSMSSLILAKHVRAGLLLADEYRLPLAVKKFIPEHHGTSIMSYFYHKAKENADSKDLNENDYRYPGPKPQSKETAIAMLSDTVEAASRTLPNPNLQRISGLVDGLIEKRFQEGELDECDITLRELNKIKSAFTRILMGVHHIRIEYPTEDSAKEKDLKNNTPKTENSVATEKNEEISLKNSDLNNMSSPSSNQDPNLNTNIQQSDDSSK